MSDALGRLRRISDLRDQWPDEAKDFTPWLAREDNLSLLAETLRIDLELVAVEQNVGAFRADILCKDTRLDRWVLIENQLERTDHLHLGQLITYAAGLDAVTIVWIAARVTDEHRAALDWLNEITDTEVRFFALEVELWCIDDSPAAPKFNVVSKPNDWSRHTTAARKAATDGELSPTRQLQRRYWEAVQARVAEADGPLNRVSAPAQSWVVHGIGKTGVLLSMVVNTRDKWIRVEVYLTGRWAKSDFAQLLAEKLKIEEAFGAALVWQELPEKTDCRICLALTDSDPADEADWTRQHEWLVTTASRLHDTFRPYVARIDRSPTQEREP